jgi:hypothetical protein
MANIPALPTGHDILKRGKAATGVAHNYGPGSCRVMLNADGSVVLTNDRTRVVASTLADGTYKVVTAQVNPANIGYVNRFIADWGKVERNWRSKEYFVRSGMTEALMAEVEQVEAIPTPAKPVKAERIKPTPAPVVEPVTAPVVTVAPVPVVATLPVSVTEAIPAPAKPIKVKRKTIAGQEMVVLDRIALKVRHYNDLHDAWDARQNGDTASVIVTGPSGTSKTLMVQAFAAELGVPFVKVDGGKIRTADDWFGGLKQDHATGQWHFRWNPFGQALKSGVKCVVLLDEANRAETAAALNAVLGLLDDTKQVWVPDAGEYVTLPDGLLVVVTANIGAEYVGTQEMDAAVLQRLGIGVRLDYLTPAVETEVLLDITSCDKDLAKKLVAMANHQRPLKDDMMAFPSGTGISTRMLVGIADRITKKGRDARDVIDSAFEAQFKVEDMTALTIVVDTYFPRAANDTLDVNVDAITEADDL